LAVLTEFTSCVYCTGLIAEQISDVSTLTGGMALQNKTRDDWSVVDACIRLFHNRRVWHADLNAHSVLLYNQLKIFLLDFNRGSFRMGQAWEKENLSLLKRSIVNVCVLGGGSLPLLETSMGTTGFSCARLRL
jgi:3-deoxy-D-manno-octulosonic acid kinase